MEVTQGRFEIYDIIEIFSIGREYVHTVHCKNYSRIFNLIYELFINVRRTYERGRQLDRTQNGTRISPGVVYGNLDRTCLVHVRTWYFSYKRDWKCWSYVSRTRTCLPRVGGAQKISIVHEIMHVHVTGSVLPQWCSGLKVKIPVLALGSKYGDLER